MYNSPDQQQRALKASLLREEGLHESDDISQGSQNLPLLLLEALRSSDESTDRFTDNDIRKPSLVPSEEMILESAARRQFKKKLYRNMGHCLGFTTFIAIVVGVPVLFYQMAEDKKLQKDYAAFYSAGVFVLCTVPISIREITKHLTHWYMPDVQKYVVRILWMIPIYSINSWLSLRFHHASLYIDTVRDLYEAYVLASFFYYLVELLGGERVLIDSLRRKEEQLGDHPSVILNKILGHWDLRNGEFFYKCKNGILQFVLVKVTTTAFISFFESLGIYGEGKFDWYHPYGYLAFINNLSATTAIYCLVKFYFATESELKSPIDWKPIGKFLCIKGVIFFTFWQGFFIAILRNVGIIGPMGNWNINQVAAGLQDYLVCMEMLFFAIAHSYTFTYREYCFTYNRLESIYDEKSMNTEDGDLFDINRTSSLKQLQVPLSVSHAVWSSALPTETITDIKILTKGSRRLSSEISSRGEMSHELHAVASQRDHSENNNGNRKR